MMDMKRDYYEDIRLFDSGVVLFWTMALLLALFTLPLYAPNYYVYLLNIIMVHIILAVGLNILVGSTGQISLGHAGFFAIGAYGTALLMAKLQIPFIFAILIGRIHCRFFWIYPRPARAATRRPLSGHRLPGIRADDHAYHRRGRSLWRPNGRQGAAARSGDQTNWASVGS